MVIIRKGIRYSRLEENWNDSEINAGNFRPCPPRYAVLLFLFFILSSAFLFHHNSTLKMLSRSVFSGIDTSQVETNKLNKDAAGFQNYYFTKQESQFLNCPELINGSKGAIDLYVNNGRMRLNDTKILDLPMDCISIKKRVIGDGFKDGSFEEPLERSIVFTRNIYELYELQEVFLSITFHPNHFYCYALDSKSSQRLKSSMRTMAECFKNVLVLSKEYDFDRAGHRQDQAHFDCLHRLLDKDWHHAITLQNFDLIIKTPRQLSELSKLLNYTSIMGFDNGLTDRYDTSADWTPKGMALFKNDSQVPDSVLRRTLTVKKSLNEVILSKMFVKSLFEKVNLKNVIERFDNKRYFGVDEMMVMTLYENYLGLDGQMESNCTEMEEMEDTLTRMTHWHLEQADGYHEHCKSKWLRHSICVLGVEYLKELSESPMVLANKVTANFDFGTILCTREMIKNGKTGKIPDAKMLSSFPQFREMLMKANGTYDRSHFKC